MQVLSHKNHNKCFMLMFLNICVMYLRQSIMRLQPPSHPPTPPPTPASHPPTPASHPCFPPLPSPILPTPPPHPPLLPTPPPHPPTPHPPLLPPHTHPSFPPTTHPSFPPTTHPSFPPTPPYPQDIFLCTSYFSLLLNYGESSNAFTYNNSNMRSKQMVLNECRILPFFKICGLMSAKWPFFFFNFANSRLPLTKYPFFRENGYERGIRFVREWGRVSKLCLSIYCKHMALCNVVYCSDKG